MKRLLSIGVAAALTLSLGQAQTVVRDDFSGGFNSALSWSWSVPGLVNECSGPTSLASFSANSLDILTRVGGFYQEFNEAHDIPNLRILDSAPRPDNWYIEMMFSADWPEPQEGNYFQVGLIIFENADSYFEMLLTRNATTDNLINGSAQMELGGWFTWGARGTVAFQPPANGSKVGLRLEYTNSYLFSGIPALILKYKPNEQSEWLDFDGTECGAIFFPADGCPGWGSWFGGYMIDFINRPELKIGLYTDTAGRETENLVSFDYIETNLPVVRMGDINADGVVDDTDLLAVLFAFGTSDTCAIEDTNNDGIVDDRDLLNVLFNFG